MLEIMNGHGGTWERGVGFVNGCWDLGAQGGAHEWVVGLGKGDGGSGVCGNGVWMNNSLQGCRWLSLAWVGYRGPMLTVTIDCRGPVLAFVGLQGFGSCKT